MNSKRRITQRYLFFLQLVLINIAASWFLIAVTATTSKAGTTRSTLFLSLGLFALVISSVVAFLAIYLRRLYRSGISVNSFFIKYLFWIQFAFLVLLFLGSWLFIEE